MLISQMLMFMSDLNCDKNSLFNYHERVWLPITTGNKILTPLHTSQNIHLVNGAFVSRKVIILLLNKLIRSYPLPKDTFREIANDFYHRDMFFLEFLSDPVCLEINSSLTIT